MPTEKGIEALLSALGVSGVMALAAVYFATLGVIWQIGLWRERVFTDRLREMDARWSKGLSAMSTKLQDAEDDRVAERAPEQKLREEITAKLTRLEVKGEDSERRLDAIDQKLDRLLERRQHERRP